MFGKKNKRDNDQQGKRLAENIAGKVYRTQTRLANYLNRKTAGTTRKQQIVFLATFTIALGVYCIYLILDSIFS
ncbi:hypothetical protein GCM10011386_38620 [Parapedobacter defluvii]|uniref:Uncharacterized protein n=1 Tax=Parapedobacter defluvii TaxID=2045106 RepID=A0ABQ1MLK4_9SPHI|nr:hypothetical protein [Parapedobacter defluvii]GGC42655.1 hypothetical protein GCM10011386_38620 [Parapedobacter defluvii]